MDSFWRQNFASAVLCWVSKLPAHSEARSRAQGALWVLIVSLARVLLVWFWSVLMMARSCLLHRLENSLLLVISYPIPCWQNLKQSNVPLPRHVELFWEMQVTWIHNTANESILIPEDYKVFSWKRKILAYKIIVQVLAGWQDFWFSSDCSVLQIEA